MKESIQQKVESRELETSSYTPFTFNLKEFEFENNIKIAKDNRNQTEKANIQFLTKKIPYFKIKKKKITSKNSNFNDGRWTKDEHNQFIQGIVLYGNNWKKVKSLIGTRDLVQVRSHAQKFFNKIKLFKNLDLGIDFTLNSINNINDMINQLKYINPNLNIELFFKNLSYKLIDKNRLLNKKNNNLVKEKNNLLIDEEQELVSQDIENNHLFKDIINENNNLKNIISNDINTNIPETENNSMCEKNYDNTRNILTNSVCLNLNLMNNCPLYKALNYNNYLFYINFYNDFLSMYRINNSLIYNLNQINYILFLINNINYNFPNNIIVNLNLYNNSANNAALFQTNNSEK